MKSVQYDVKFVYIFTRSPELVDGQKLLEQAFSIEAAYLKQSCFRSLPNRLILLVPSKRNYFKALKPFRLKVARFRDRWLI